MFERIDEKKTRRLRTNHSFCSVQLTMNRDKEMKKKKEVEDRKRKCESACTNRRLPVSKIDGQDF